MGEKSLATSGVEVDHRRTSVSFLSEGKMATDSKPVGIQDYLCVWDPDAANLLKVVDNEDLDALQELLANGVHINGHGGSFHETALHRASQIGWAAGVNYLVSAGASLYAKNQFGQTPLHYAAKASKSPACIRLLLETGRPGVLDHRDMRGHTPLHDASASGCVSAINLLLKAGALVSARDGNGETPLHKAARARSIPSMVALLNAGGDLAAVDSNGESVLSYVLHHLPGTMDALFDYCLVTNSSKIDAKTLEVTMNFLPLTGPYEKNQVQNLQTFVQQGHAKLLTHPLCEMFLNLKWRNVRYIFLIEVIIYLLYAILTTLMTFDKFVGFPDLDNITKGLNESESENCQDCNVSINDSESENCQYCNVSPIHKILNSIILTLTVLILVQQLLSILQYKLAWFRSFSGVLHVVITILVLAVIPYAKPQAWQYHLASILLLLMWTECMLLIGRFPSCGIYVVMFTRVLKVFVKIFAIYICLLVAFSSAFYITMHCHREEDPKENSNASKNDSSEDTDSDQSGNEKEIFSNPFLTFMKTLTMMIGEVDFSDLNGGLYHLQVTGHVIFLLFVILVSIILSNLLVALAVNDVQGLRNSAHLERLIKQTELVYKMEKNFATASYIARHIKGHKFQSVLTKISHICKHDCKQIRVFMLPNSPKKGNRLFFVKDKKCNESNLPSHLLIHVMECLRNREAYDKSDNKGSVKNKRGSRIRRGGDYTRDAVTDLKDLEANVTELVSEKMEDLLDSHGSLSKRMASLEEKLQKITELLVLAKTDNAGFLTSSSSETHNSGSVSCSTREVKIKDRVDEHKL